MLSVQKFLTNADSPYYNYNKENSTNMICYARLKLVTQSRHYRQTTYFTQFQITSQRMHTGLKKVFESI